MRVPIKFKLALVISSLVVPLLLVLSFLFYWQFRSALDQRVLLQLSSIKQLKSVQIEDYLKQEWHRFKTSATSYEDGGSGSLDQAEIVLIERQDYPNSANPAWRHLLALDQEGIHDLSHLSSDGKILIGYYVILDSTRRAVRISPAEKIQQIVLERTGMGETGETYLVGPDYTLRSLSRFLTEDPPTSIAAKTQGVLDGFHGAEGSGIFPDYREVMVFSTYSLLQVSFVRWVILSELDKSEAHQPLESMRNRLIMILFAVLSVTLFGSFWLANSLVKPLVNMKARLIDMSRGNFSAKRLTNYRKDEIGDMFKALDELVKSIKQAMGFANAIGSMKLDTEYEMLSEHDSLGRALINMQQHLKDFQYQEEQMQLHTQKAILRGQEKDRERLSREMHDGLGPLLTSLRMIIQQLEITNDLALVICRHRPRHKLHEPHPFGNGGCGTSHHDSHSIARAVGCRHYANVVIACRNGRKYLPGPGFVQESPSRRHACLKPVWTATGARHDIEKQTGRCGRQKFAFCQFSQGADNGLRRGAIDGIGQIPFQRSLARGDRYRIARHIKTPPDRIFLLPFHAGDAALQSPLPRTETDSAEFFSGNESANGLRTTRCTQQGIVGGIIARRDGLLKQTQNRFFDLPVGDNAFPNRLMKNGEVIGCNPDTLVQPQLALIDQIQNSHCNPCFRNALLGKQIIQPAAQNPIATVNAHDGNAGLSGEKAPLLMQ